MGMLNLEREQTEDIFQRMIPPIHVIPEKDDGVLLVQVSAGHLLGRIEITMGIPDKNRLPAIWQGNQPGFILKNLTCPFQ